LNSISADFRHSILALEFSFLKPETEPKYPGANVSFEYYIQVAGSWYHVHTENASLQMWKYACVTINFSTKQVTFSTESFLKEMKVNKVKHSKAELLENWNQSHLWTSSETVSQINVFTTSQDHIKCGDIGDLIAWTSPYWSIENQHPELAKRTIQDDDICKEGPLKYVVNIPLEPSFWGAVSTCKLIGDGQVTAYYNLEDWNKASKKVIEDIGSFAYMWFSIIKVNGSFISF